MSNKRHTTFAAIGFAGLLALTGCGSDDSAATTTTAAAGTPSGATGDAIEIPEFKFAPANLTVTAGTEVTVTNSHTQPHTATSKTNGVFDTGSISGDGGTATFTVDEPGEYAFICSFHPFMEGTLTVQ